MPAITPYQVALGVGAAGALVDVSSYIDFAYGINFSSGRADEFRAPNFGQFTFTLDNYDGRFTPNNPSSAYAATGTTVTEGMAACVNVGGRLTAGSIQTIQFPSDEANWGHVTITCVDMLGTSSRTQLTSLANSMVLGSTPYLYWPLNDAIGSSSALEVSGNNGPALTFQGSGNVFGAAGFDALGGDTQLAAVTPPGTTLNTLGSTPVAFPTIAYQNQSIGCWGAWFTPTNASAACYAEFIFRGAPHSVCRFGIDNTAGLQWFLRMGGHNVYSFLPVPLNVPHYVAAVVTYNGPGTIVGELFVDGISQGTASFLGSGGDPSTFSTNAARQPIAVGINDPYTSGNTVYVAHLSHTATRVDEYLASATSEASRWTALDQTSTDVTLAAPPADLSPAPIGYQPTGGSLFDALQSVAFTEQGYLDTATTGTLTSPAQTITIRARTRPASATYTFDAFTEVANVPEFVRDLTNMASGIVTTGAVPVTTSSTRVSLGATAQQAPWRDLTLVPRVGNANITETVLSSNYSDILGWSQDRINRGENVNLRVASVLIDARTTPTDRSADLLAMNFGDRIQISNLPAATLGFTTYDGWLIGVEEVHRGGAFATASFKLYLSPVLPATAIYDTNLFMSGGLHTLNATITSGATSLGVLSSDLLTYFETSATPYTITIDSEQISVTACGSPSAGVQTMTVTRAANGTVAAAHTAGAFVEIATPSLYAF